MRRTLVGEGAYSFNVGCAVALTMSGSVRDTCQIMRHIGWFGVLHQAGSLSSREINNKCAGMIECIQYDWLSSACSGNKS